MAKLQQLSFATVPASPWNSSHFPGTDCRKTCRLDRKNPRKLDRIICAMKTKSQTKPLVAVLMGSRNDYAVMRAAVDILREFGVPYEARVVSAHRTPDQMFAYAESAASRGLRVIIAGAGGAAHVAGMLAAKSTVPVHRRSHRGHRPPGLRFAALHRPDAEGRSRGHVCHRGHRRSQRCNLRRADSRRHRPRIAGQAHGLACCSPRRGALAQSLDDEVKA